MLTEGDVPYVKIIRVDTSVTGGQPQGGSRLMGAEIEEAAWASEAPNWETEGH